MLVALRKILLIGKERHAREKRFFLLKGCLVRMGSLGSHPMIPQENIVDALKMAEAKEQHP